MKIAMLTSSYPKWPGETTAPFIEEIAVHLAARGHEVHVLMPHRSDLRRESFERGVHLHTYRYAPAQALEVWGYAAALHGDVGLKASTAAAMPLALGSGLLALLKLTECNSFDLIHGHWVLPNGPVAALVAQQRNLPLTLSLHGSDVFLAERTWLTAWASRWAARHAGGISSCSGDLAARLVALGGPPERTEVVPYGIDPAEFYPDAAAGAAMRARLEIDPDRPLLVWLSRMVHKKGLNVLLDAMPDVLRERSDTMLVLGGYGDLRADLERQARRLGIERNVLFPGAIARDAVNAFWNAGDLVVIPAVRDQWGNVDGLPNIVLESMSAGRPIVASHIAGIPQVITSGEHGLLTPPGDSQQLAASILQLLRHRQLATQLGTAARQRVERELRWTHVAERFERIYKQAQAFHNGRTGRHGDTETG